MRPGSGLMVPEEEEVEEEEDQCPRGRVEGLKRLNYSFNRLGVNDNRLVV